MVWTHLILCAVYRDTFLSPDVTTVTAQHCSPLDDVAPAAIPLASATVLKPQHDSASRTPEECTVYLTATTNIGKQQSIGTLRRWESNLRRLRLAAQQSDVLTTACATASFPKKNGLDAAYIMRRLPRHGSLARCYHRHCPTRCNLIHFFKII